MWYIVLYHPRGAANWSPWRTDGPVNATNPEEAYKKSNTGTAEKIKVIPLQTDENGALTEYDLENLQLEEEEQ